MKKSLLALAVLGAFAGAAQAQSAVTIYGSIDAGLRHTNPAAGGLWTMGSFSAANGVHGGTYNSNRIGFKGVEDLGGGLNAHFNLESGFDSANGGLDNTTNQLFNRSAFVGIGGSWGSLDLGRQYSVNFKTIGSYDPFSYKYVQILPPATQGGLTRLNNDVQYSGKFGPVTAYAEYAFGETAGEFSTGSTKAVGATYAEGPITVGGAYTRQNAAGTGNPIKNWTVGGAYATGPFRVAVGYADNKVDAGTDTKDWWLGGNYNLTAEAAVTAGYYQKKATTAASVETKNNLFIVGGTYALSKRTNLYADIDYTRTKVSTGAEGSLTGFSAGINHLF